MFELSYITHNNSTNNNTDPVNNNNDPINNDPINNNTDPVNNDPVNNDPVNNDPVNNDPVNNDPVNNNTDDPIKNLTFADFLRKLAETYGSSIWLQKWKDHSYKTIKDICKTNATDHGVLESFILVGGFHYPKEFSNEIIYSLIERELKKDLGFSYVKAEFISEKDSNINLILRIT